MLSRSSPYFRAIMPSLPSLTFKSLKSTWSVIAIIASHDHDNVKMKLFALSLEDDAEEWYFDLDDDSYKTLSEFLEGYKNKWGENKKPRHLLVSLHNIKKMENETMDEYNTKFRRVVADLTSLAL